jgi:serine/threonine protein kinase
VKFVAEPLPPTRVDRPGVAPPTLADAPSPGWARGQPISFPLDFGRFRLERKLGQGGMGSVYFAVDTKFDQPVAIKIPSAYLGDNSMLRERFFREAKLAAALQHPSICPVFDVGQYDGVFYLVMPFIEGKPLSRFIVPGQRLPARNVATVVRALARAMHAAHTQGIIHRDLKPSNIMIGTNKRPIIMDFGLAKSMDAADNSGLTTTGTLMGTPQYMSPEQIDGDIKRIGPRSDVYSLGVILYELLAGQRPFEGPLSQLIAQIALQPPPALRNIRPDLDATLEAICVKAMAKQPEHRFADMQQFATALSDWLAGKAPDLGLPADEDEESVVIQLIDQMAANVARGNKGAKALDTGFDERPSVVRQAIPTEEYRATYRRPRRHGRGQPDWVNVLLKTLIPGIFVMIAVIGIVKAWSWWTGK